MKTPIDFSLENNEKLIELFPYGVTVGSGYVRPVMIFKDKSEKNVLPVWLSPLDAGIAVSQQSVQSMSSSPHNLTWKILKPLGIELEKCCFTKISGHHQFVDLHFKGDDRITRLESRADEAISFCLSTKTKFFCSIKFIEECRDLEMEMTEMEEVVLHSDDLEKKDHNYIN